MKTRLAPILLFGLSVLFVRAQDIPITNVAQTLPAATYYLPSDGTFPDSAFTAFQKINTNILSLLIRISRKADTNDIALLQAQINSLVSNTNGITSAIATNIADALIRYATNQLSADLRDLIARKANTNSPTIWSPTIRSGALLFGDLEIKDGEAKLYFGPSFSLSPTSTGLAYTDWDLNRVTWRVHNGDIIASGAGFTNLQSTNLSGYIPPARMGANTPAPGYFLRYLNSGSGYWSPLQVALTNILTNAASPGDVIKFDGTNWVPQIDNSSDPGTLGGWLTNWQTQPVAAFSSAPTVGYALGWDGSKWTPMTMLQIPPFTADVDQNLFVNGIGSPFQRIEASGNMKFYTPSVDATVFTAATGFRGQLRTATGEYPIYDHTAGAPILYYDGTTVWAVTGKGFGGNGASITNVQWAAASIIVSNAQAYLLANGNGKFGNGAVTLSDEGVFGTLHGNGAEVTAINAGNLGSGTVPLARMSGITSNQVASSTDLIYRNTPRVLAGSNVSVSQGTDASGHTTYTVGATAGSGAFNYELTETTVTTGNSSTFDDAITSSQFGFYDYTIFVRTAAGDWHWDKEHRSVVLGAIDEANDYANFDNSSPGFSGISITASYASGNFRLTLSNSSGGTCYWRVFGTKKVF